MTHELGCLVCGGPASTSVEAVTAYDHTKDCRIRQSIERRRGVEVLREMLMASSLGTPGAQVLIKIGRLSSQGMEIDEIHKQLTDEEKAAAEGEMRRIEGELRAMDR